MSMCQFLIMTSDLLGVVAKAGGNMGYDWLRYLITRYEPGRSLRAADDDDHHRARPHRNSRAAQAVNDVSLSTKE